jgi:hypothetical protein
LYAYLLPWKHFNKPLGSSGCLCDASLASVFWLLGIMSYITLILMKLVSASPLYYLPEMHMSFYSVFSYLPEVSLFCQFPTVEHEVGNVNEV